MGRGGNGGVCGSCDRGFEKDPDPPEGVILTVKGKGKEKAKAKGEEAKGEGAKG